MDKLEIALYGGAVYLAIKSLVSLMADHSRTFKQRLAQELIAAKKAAAKTDAEETPPPEKSERPFKKAG
ncbi:MAG TPA: hypothetical protein VEI07_22205 [Planctomycetaceae bacterium]|nr:hypothetical protein [Planctomycetaceae bacterium]